MIDETKYAFGIDFARYVSALGLMDFKAVAQHKPLVRFMGIRHTISYAYKDPFHKYHMEEAVKVHEYRKTLMPDLLDFYPVGRMPYHVLYPAQSVQSQADNFFEACDLSKADWTHDRPVIDAELDHGQSKQRITDAINTFGNICRSRTGKLPILYSRYYWLRDKTFVDQLLDFDMWLAQYLSPKPWPLKTPEYPPPPRHFADRGWLAHQTSEHGEPIGTDKKAMDYNRWNGGIDSIVDYFQLQEEVPIPPANLEERVTDLERRVTYLEDTAY